MDINKRLEKLDSEIDTLTKKIGATEEEWKKEANPERAAVFLESIAVLNARLDARIATRDALLLLAAAPAPSPGKNTPSRPRRQCPPSTRELATPPARCRVP